MNMMIGLSKKHPTYPDVLAEEGFMLESIGTSFLDSKGNEVNPDIMFKCHNENSLFLLDCKSGTLKKKQSEVYKKLTPKEVKEQNITSLSGDFELDKSWVCSDENLDKVKEKNEEWEINFPILFENDEELKKDNSSNFNSNSLEDIFEEGVSIDGRIPTSYYPFSPEDSEEYVMFHMIQGLIKLSLDDTFKLEDLLRETHDLYDYLDEKEKKKLKRRVGKIMKRFERDEFKEYLNKVPDSSNEWEIIDGRIRGFRNQAQDLMNEAREDIEEDKNQEGLGKFL